MVYKKTSRNRPTERESQVQNKIRLGLSENGVMNFRVNVGRAWTGDSVEKINPRDIIIRNARPFSTGLPPGFSDIIAAPKIEITSDMVGCEVAVFTVIEIKSGSGRATDLQKRFIEAVLSQGGRGGVARTLDEALDICKRK